MFRKLDSSGSAAAGGSKVLLGLAILNIVVLFYIFSYWQWSCATVELLKIPDCVSSLSAVELAQLDATYAQQHPDFITVPLRYGFTANVDVGGTDQRGWWVDVLPTWENTTFLYFNTFIRNTTTYIGMGEWIGPVLLFSAKKALRAVGAEPDPSAFSVLQRNVLANPSLSHKISLSKLCISLKAETVIMYGAGGSGSFMSAVDNVEGHKEYQAKYPTMSWVSHCLPFWTFADEHNAITGDMFIKLDTEGAEQFILPSIYPWLANFTLTTSFQHKPAMFISFHGANHFPPKALDQIIALIHLYKWYSHVDEKIVFHPGNQFELTILQKYPWLDVYLSDRDLSEYS